MDISNKTNNSVVIDVTANETVDSSDIKNLNFAGKGYVYSFTAGTLEVSFDNTTWTEVSTSPNTPLEFNISAAPYLRLTANGKLNLIFL